MHCFPMEGAQTTFLFEMSAWTFSTKEDATKWKSAWDMENN